MTAILVALLQPGGLVAAILDIVRDHFAQTGKILTLDELRASALKKADEIIATGDAFDAAHPRPK